MLTYEHSDIPPYSDLFQMSKKVTMVPSGPPASRQTASFTPLVAKMELSNCGSSHPNLTDSGGSLLLDDLFRDSVSRNFLPTSTLHGGIYWIQTEADSEVSGWRCLRGCDLESLLMR
jgi:hypothetical protein